MSPLREYVIYREFLKCNYKIVTHTECLRYYEFLLKEIVK